MLFLLWLIVAYLLGSLSSAIILCKLIRLPDPRSQGSGNPGATNVLRLAGKKLAILVLISDVLKGVAAVGLAKWGGLDSHLLGWVALAVFVGHLFPIFFGFQGGKGVATAFGVLLILAWPLALAVLVTWLMVALIFRYSSLAALTAALFAPIYGYWLLASQNYFPVVIICGLLLIRHYSNIYKLFRGQETKIKLK